MDLVYYEDALRPGNDLCVDAEDCTAMKASVKVFICQLDYIIPGFFHDNFFFNSQNEFHFISFSGHGPGFAVKIAYKEAFNCTPPAPTLKNKNKFALNHE